MKRVPQMPQAPRMPKVRVLKTKKPRIKRSGPAIRKLRSPVKKLR